MLWPPGPVMQAELPWAAIVSWEKVRSGKAILSVPSL